MSYRSTVHALMLMRNSPAPHPKSGVAAATYSIASLYSDLAWFAQYPILILNESPGLPSLLHIPI